MGNFIGVDLHKNNFVVCVMSESEEIKEEKRYHLSKLDEFKRSLTKEDEVGVESTGNTRYFVNQIKEYVKVVRVVNTRQFKVISVTTKKTDFADAEKIAYFLSKGMIPEVKLKDDKTAKINSLVNTRDRFVKLRTALKNKIHNILSSNGYDTKREFLSSEKSLNEISKYKVDEVSELELEVIVEQIHSLNKSISKLDKEIDKKGKGMKGYENITSIKGIGSKSATTLLSVIGEIDNFESDKKLASYLGIVPRVHSSNQTTHTGRITKKGNKLGRTTLVQCAFVSIKYSNYLRSFYDRIKVKKGCGKAIIATARKLLGIIYIVLKQNLIFEDFSNFIFKQTFALNSI